MSYLKTFITQVCNVDNNAFVLCIKRGFIFFHFYFDYTPSVPFKNSSVFYRNRLHERVWSPCWTGHDKFRF